MRPLLAALTAVAMLPAAAMQPALLRAANVAPPGGITDSDDVPPAPKSPPSPSPMQPAASPSASTPAAPGNTAAGEDPERVVITGKRWLFNRETRYAHSLPEVNGAEITVTKKTSVVRLDAQPPVIDNNQREIYDRLPGIVLAEQQNPTQLNLSYRGLGNPQESEYLLVMQDGIPLELDWIGFPTLYYLPVPQTVEQLQMIRGGSGLLYGPEPQPALNYISRSVRPGDPFSATTEQTGGSDSLFSSFNAVRGSSGPFDYQLDYAHRQSQGERLNGDYHVNSGDLTLGYAPDTHQKLSLALHLYAVQSGLAGLMSGAQFRTDPQQTTTPDDRLWTDRDSLVLSYTNQFDEHNYLAQKMWFGYSDLITRSGSYDANLAGTGAVLAGQHFHSAGLDGRFRHSWGRGNAFTVGYTLYGSRSPYDEFRGSNPLVDRDDESGTRIYSDDRTTRYGALFAEGLFRLPGFHIVTSARFDHERLSTAESVAPHPLLANQTYSKNVPLFAIGIGNDFGRGNETYLNVAQGFRPLRYLDIASPFSNFGPGNNPDPTRYLTYELGVHGWPLVGVYYDASLFQVNAHDRIESRQLTLTETIDVNTGSTRSRGAEFEGSWDLLRLWPQSQPQQHLELFANASLLNARFTDSTIPGQTGKVPAYAPAHVLKAGLNARIDARMKVSLVVDSVAAQFFQDSNQPIASTPARIPAYTVLDLSAEFFLGRHLRLLGGIANLTDRRYYSRVFISRGLLEPGRERSGWAGVAYDF